MREAERKQCPRDGGKPDLSSAAPILTIGWKTIDVDGGPMRTYVAMPGGAAPVPAILVAQHGGGVDVLMQDAAHRLFRAGYTVAAPELFHRQPDDTDRTKRVGLLLDTEIIADLRAVMAFLKASERPYTKLGIVGFCMGGRVSYLAATALSGLDAAVVFYGGNIMKALGAGPSPFERSATINCPLLAMGGVEDTNPSPADFAKIDAELTRLGKPHEIHLYQNAGHAFHNFAEPRYRQRAARASWHAMRAFFAEHLDSKAE